MREVRGQQLNEYFFFLTVRFKFCWFGKPVVGCLRALAIWSDSFSREKLTKTTVLSVQQRIKTAKKLGFNGRHILVKMRKVLSNV